MNTSNRIYFQGLSKDGSIDFYLTFDINQDEYIADIFKADIEYSNEAYIDTLTFKSFNEAINDLSFYQLSIRK